jgi:hypothetical protein
LLPKRGMIENFPVVNDPKVPSFIRHGLIARGYVDNAETPMAERSPVVLVVAVTIGAPMRDGVGHSADRRITVFTGHSFDESGNAAHILSIRADIGKNRGAGAICNVRKPCVEKVSTRHAESVRHV